MGKEIRRIWLAFRDDGRNMKIGGVGKRNK